jgi:capsular polysaccharide biosynthesis protein
MPSWLDRVRRRAPAIVALAALAAGVAAVYSLTATKRYEARAELLVSPLPADDKTFDGFGLPREGGAAAETIARLVRTPEVAEAVQAELGLRGSVSSHRVDGSQLVAVVGKASSAARAAQVANGFADALVAERTARFQATLATAIRRLRARLRAGVGGPAEQAALARRLSVLTGLVATRDPTLEVASTAVAPSDPVWPRPWLIPVAAAAALAVATLASVLVPRPPPPPPPAPPPPPPPRPEPKPEPAPEPEPEPEPESEPPPQPVTGGAWNLTHLRRLVEERGASFPEARVELWRSYLFLLQEHAGPDGALPSSFDALVEAEFRDLLEA